MNRSEAMSQLAHQGVAKVVLEFSGGNDEGGADSITCFDADGLALALHFDTYYYDNSLEAQLVEVLEEPIYAEYGGFGFEGYVSGTLTWDVASGTGKMTRSEQVWTEMDDIDY